jgi:hypothetical protein
VALPSTKTTGLNNMAHSFVGVAPGVSTMTFPSGRVVRIDDYCDTELWGTFDFNGQLNVIDPFSVGRSQYVPGSNPVRSATNADTNLPRPGYSGLPQDHDFIMYGWRAAVVAPREVIVSDAAQAWFATTSVQFKYNMKLRAEWPLSELLRTLPPDAKYQAPGAPSDMDPDAPKTGQLFVLPIEVRQQLGFEALVTPQCVAAVSALRITTAHVGCRMSVRIFLRGLYKTTVY